MEPIVSISQSQADGVRRMLDEGKMSQRQIATRTGVSRGTVGLAAKGYHVGPAIGIAAKKPLGEVGRCPYCGAMARLPCLECRVNGSDRDG